MACVIHLGQKLGTSGFVAARAVTAVALRGEARRRRSLGVSTVQKGAQKARGACTVQGQHKRGLVRGCVSLQRARHGEDAV